MSELPKGWAKATLGDIAMILRGVTYKKEHASQTPQREFIPLLRATNIAQSLSFEDLYYIPRQYVSEIQYLQIGDIVIAASSGSLSVVGKAAILNSEWFGTFGAFCSVARPNSSISSMFIGYHLQTPGYREYVSSRAAGVNINNLKSDDLASFEIAIAPRGEQDRIVAEIEKQFTRLDAATAALKRVQANLKRYRASVLKAACEGRLVSTEVELARKEGRDYEPASELLKRILRERRARWEADTLAKMTAAGKRPTDDRWKQKYKEPSAPDSAFDFEVPSGWCVASMDQLTSRITSGSRDWSKFYDRGSGTFVMAQNVRPSLFDMSVRQSVDPPKDDSGILRCQIEKDDLLVTIVGANTGDVCLVPDYFPEHYVCQSVALMRPVLSSLSAYLELFMNSDEHGQKVYERYTYGAGRPHISFEQLKSTPVLLPPEHEAERIIENTSGALEALSRQNGTVANQVAKITALRSALLESAFTGQLVPQDPTDEPASVLLERIRAKRDAATAQKPARRGRKEPAYV